MPVYIEKINGDVTDQPTDQPTDRANIEQSAFSKLDKRKKAEICNSKYRPKLASESRLRFNFITCTKYQRLNVEQTPASKSCLNFNSKIFTTFCSKFAQNFGFMIKPQLPNLQQTVANTIHIINISNSNNLSKF